MKPYAFGIDIGGTAVKTGLFQTDGTLLEKWKIPTRTEENGRFVLPDALDSIQTVLERRGLSWAEIEGVGMGVPGPVGEDGMVLRCINLGWDVFSVPGKMRELEPRLNKVRVANDVNAAALGELWQGGAKGRGSAFMITLGTGIGGGLVIDGEIITGNRGGAGELGHLKVDFNEHEHCKCGGCGCLEQYCSATGLLRCAKRALVEHPERESSLRNIKNLTAKSVCDAAKQGDELALALLDQLGQRLGWALTAAAGTADPQVFVIGGGLSNAGHILLNKIELYYRKYAFHAFRDTEFVLAKLGNDAGIYGCVRMLL